MKDENVCCPLLQVIGCADTNKHSHLYCDAYHTIKDALMDNEWVRKFCVDDFEECEYYPIGED